MKKKPTLADLSLSKNLFSEITLLIEQSKSGVQIYANSTLTMLYWHIGKLINDDILQNKRAEYGKQIVPLLASQLTEQYGRSYEVRNIRRMMQFAEFFPEIEIVSPLAAQLTWTHFIEILSLKTSEERLFYAQLTASEHLSKRQLRRKIATKTYDRTELANFQIGVNSIIPPNVFKDPYVLDFLGLKNTYLEKDMEEAILRELEEFILELGNGFAFLERQKRIILDGEDFYLDLLFYHRKIKRLVAIELKLGKFEAKYKGQMELYLKYLDRYEKAEGENSPIGLILCAGESREQIELLEMHKDGIMVAEYLTELPPKKELEKKLHALLLEARERLATNTRKTKRQQLQ
ncbi:MAG: PDDEXK nuclease domain-containing protein [Planctomycetaceae bacterium]|jgi:predicted nuclease of restriction endonuclease-like (RecB) superfamily|nr:PDDEXK nuclease domain-containing protein [Planctomycetaceae bacterium]